MSFNKSAKISQSIGFLFLLLIGTHTVLGQSASSDLTPKTIEINGANLHYIEKGDGETVVLVHGGLGDLNSFQEQINTFAEA